MTVPIEPSNTLPEKVVSGMSRYIDGEIVFYGEQKFLTFTTYNRKAYKPTGKEKILLIKKGVEFRPDLVSYDAYGFVDAWWKILEANGMKDVFEFKAGVTIIIPNLI